MAAKDVSQKTAFQSKVPGWASEPVFQLIDWGCDINRALGAIERALGLAVEWGPIREKAINLRFAGREPAEVEQRKEAARADATSAAETLRDGFPILLAQSLVGLYGALEVMVDDLTATWICNEPSVLAGESFSKITLPVGEYLTLSKAKRAERVTEELKRSLSVDDRDGVNRFEHLLRAIGLDGAVDKQTRDSLFALQQLRHVIVHRRGITDTRFVQKCPHLGFSEGEQVVVDSRSFWEYGQAVARYACIVLVRLGEHFGVDPVSLDEFKRSVQGSGYE
ncbi:MAG: hypothetical protein JXA57_15820 [Armatimonadetes bacterium]|nr:hypothetical protein [Armatimonadota bacterium]